MLDASHTINEILEQSRYQMTDAPFAKMRVRMIYDTHIVLNNWRMAKLKSGRTYDVGGSTAIGLIDRGSARRVLKTETVTIEKVEAL